MEQAAFRRGHWRDRLFLLLATSTGFRVSELLTLTFAQILGDDGQPAREITISRRLLKGGRSGRAKAIRSRRVPLSECARKAIEEFTGNRTAVPAGDSFVFASRKGINRPVTRCHVNAMLKDLARDAGIDPARIGCHSTRRAFARGVYANSNHDVIACMRLLGHQSPTTTARYLESCTDDLDNLVLGFDPVASAARPTCVAAPSTGANPSASFRGQWSLEPAPHSSAA